MSKTNAPLQGMRVAIFALDGVENTELTEPRKALEQAGAKTTVFSSKRALRPQKKREKGGTRWNFVQAACGRLQKIEKHQRFTIYPYSRQEVPLSN